MIAWSAAPTGRLRNRFSCSRARSRQTASSQTSMLRGVRVQAQPVREERGKGGDVLIVGACQHLTALRGRALPAGGVAPAADAGSPARPGPLAGQAGTVWLAVPGSAPTPAAGPGRGSGGVPYALWPPGGVWAHGASG